MLCVHWILFSPDPLLRWSGALLAAHIWSQSDSVLNHKVEHNGVLVWTTQAAEMLSGLLGVKQKTKTADRCLEFVFCLYFFLPKSFNELFLRILVSCQFCQDFINGCGLPECCTMTFSHCLFSSPKTEVSAKSAQGHEECDISIQTKSSACSTVKRDWSCLKMVVQSGSNSIIYWLSNPVKFKMHFSKLR